jgi:class 3 adenylate cyclase/tetratricopeptide (TPR) repeat protein
MTERASTATVVFTELAGAAALRARLGEDRADALQRIHDRILRARFDAGGGRVLKRQGDGVVAVFPSASDALMATVRVQQALSRYNGRPDALAELSLRVGISTGDVSWDGGDCFGTPMVEAARLMAEADPGQVLCSEFVCMMARGRGGHDFADIGLLELKGLPEPLAASVLSWAPAPDAVMPLPRELAVGSDRPFVSRAAELARAHAVMSDAAEDRTRIFWLLGEPGIGKTELAAEIARRGQADGAVILFGRCNEDLTVPYQPFLEALRFFTALVPDDELLERLGDSPGELVRLLPELAARLPDDDGPRGRGPEGEQYRLFEAMRSWLAAAGGPCRVVLVLDDLHWAARPTLQLLGHVARSTEPSRLVLVGTGRNTSPDDNEALAALIEDLERKGVPSDRFELGGLEVDGVETLVSSAAGRHLDDRLRTLAVALTAETSGNPLFLHAVLDGLPADPAWHAGALPRSVAETVRRRVARLPEAVHDVLRTASVVGLDFELPVAALASGKAELDTLEALETAGRAGLVLETGVDQYRFAHALVRAALRDQLTRSRLVRIHLAVGEAIEAHHASNLDEQAAALAYHFSEAVPAGGAEKAYRYSLLAAGRAERLLAFPEAADAYRRAIRILDHLDDPDHLARARLLLAQGKAERRSSDFRAALGTLRVAADQARRLGAADLLAGAAIAFEDASFEPGFLGAEAVDLLLEAQAALGAGHTPAHILATAGLARALEFSGRHDEAVATGERAEAMAEELGEPRITGEVLYRLGFTRIVTSALPEMAEGGAQLIQLGRQLGDDKFLFFGAWAGVYSATRLGDLATADRCLETLTMLDQRAAEPLWRWEVLLFRTARAMLSGDLVLADDLFRRMASIEHPAEREMESVVGVITFLLRREQGRLAGLAPMLRTIVDLNPTATLWGPGLGALYAELGMLDDARAQLERLAADDFSAVPRDRTREQVLAFLAEVAAAVGDSRRAAWLFDELLPEQGLMLLHWGNDTCHGPTDRLLGMLASTAGRFDEAEGWFERALSFSRGLPSPLWEAHCLFDHAAHRRRAGRSGADEMLAEAADLCQRHGLVGLGEKVGRAIGYPYAAAGES